MPRDYEPKNTKRARKQRALRAENHSLMQRGEKKCSQCMRIYALEGFPGRKNKEGDRVPGSLCVHCNRAKAAAWAKDNRGKCKNRSRDWRDETRTNTPFYPIFSSARSRAKKRGIPFTISYEDLLPLPTHCPVLGIELDYCNKKVSPKDSTPLAKPNSASIERLNPKGGYTKENTHIVSWRANFLKRDATIDELERIFRWVSDCARK